MSILELLVKAKKLYLENQGKTGMCWCIKTIANEGKSRSEQSNKGQVPYKIIAAQIPDFNPFFLNAPIFPVNMYLDLGLEFWWDINDSKSRIEAFDKLIKLYENVNREFV